MKRLDRYVLKELFVPLLIGTIVIALLFVANEFIAIFKQFEISHVPPLVIIQLVIFKTPFWLNLTLPVGMALGASLAISRLTRESELTAMRAAGIPIRRVFIPVLAIGIGVACLNFFLVERVIPRATAAYRKLSSEFLLLGMLPKFRSEVVLKLDRYNASFGTVARRDDGTLELTDIVMFERPRMDEAFIYQAKSGTYRDGVWRFQNPYVWNVRGIDLVAGRSRSEIVINEKLEIPDLFMPADPAEETVGTLRRKIDQARSIGQSATLLEVSYWVKFTIPASCLIFALTSSLLAVRLAKAGPFIGVMASLGLVVVYYNAHIISTEIIGRNGWMNPFWSAWLPNILYLAVAAILSRRLE